MLARALHGRHELPCRRLEVGRARERRPRSDRDCPRRGTPARPSRRSRRHDQRDVAERRDQLAHVVRRCAAGTARARAERHARSTPWRQRADIGTARAAPPRSEPARRTPPRGLDGSSTCSGRRTVPAITDTSPRRAARDHPRRRRSQRELDDRTPARQRLDDASGSGTRRRIATSAHRGCARQPAPWRGCEHSPRADVVVTGSAGGIGAATSAASRPRAGASPASKSTTTGGGVRALDRLDALVCAHGISGRRYGDGPVEECTEEGWDTVLEST